MLVNMYKMMYKVCFELIYNYGVEKRLGQRFYEEVIMCICCYVVGEAWYDIIILKLDWYKYGKT